MLTIRTLLAVAATLALLAVRKASAVEARIRRSSIQAPLQDPGNSNPEHLAQSTIVEPQPPIDAPASLVNWMKSSLDYARSTYCLEGLADWQCATCKALATQGTTNVSLLGDPINNSFGFVAVNPPSKLIVLAFRGTRNLDNWIKDLMAANSTGTNQTTRADAEFPGSPAESRVHMGFLAAWEFLRDDAIARVGWHLNQNPDYTILVTGHSLGGAIATMASVDLVTRANINANKIIIMTINQPRVGNPIFAQWIASFDFQDSLRLVNENDLTP
eukprot:jgi/Hompol1/2867/HPOL_006200-RA